FQRGRYWFDTPAIANDPNHLGLDALTHPILGAAVELADGNGSVFTGQLSLRTHPWLADHAVLGTVLLPGAALVELVLHAADAVGCDVLDELTLEEPLVVPATGGVQVQVTVGAPDDGGRRPVGVHSRPDDEAPWTRHAAGAVLAAGSGAAPEDGGGERPAQAESLPVDDLYAGMAQAGYEYGPVFQGLTAAWRDGDTLYAEVALPEETDVAGFGIHPALLDAALHTMGLARAADGVRLPFAWSGVRLYATGATSVRVRLTPAGPDSVALTLTDPSGAPVASIESLTARLITPEQQAALRAPGQDPLYAVDWIAAPGATAAPGTGRWALLGSPDAPGLASLAAADAIPELVLLPVTGHGTDPAETPQAVRQATARVLRTVQEWLAEPRFAEARLVVVTRDAVAVRPGQVPGDLSAAALWGLVASAISENPDRLALADIDAAAAEDPASCVPALLDGEEQRVAIRDGAAYVPRMARLDAATAEAPAGAFAGIDPEGTVLITGATGTLGRLLATHLVTTHGARHLLLTSRSGPNAPGAPQLQEELTTLGATTVTLTACDTADRRELNALLAAIPEAHPLTCVYHAAGVLDDGVVSSLTPERLDTVMRPKVDAAWHLHELTREHAPDLRHFVLFSSMAGVLGSPGQANYAAANTFLDALAEQRRGEDLAALSIAWGRWEESSTMTADLDAADLARMSRGGMRPLSAEQGLTLLDAALRQGDRATVSATRLDLAALRSGPVPPLMRGLVRTHGRRRADAGEASGGALAQRLAALPEEERGPAVLEMVRQQIAAVLGRGTAESVRPDRPFKELGFDSLTAVELRNRLGAALGRKLPATLVFDHPTPEALAAYLLAGLAPADTRPPILAELDRLEAALAALGPADREPERDEQITARLQAVLAQWGAERPASGPTVVDRIKSASTDEIFAFIDNELGRSVQS
ncbi:SDR family NAD(P)-dependent oxidoreductase, partial [Streptomyces sp. 6N223]|uniref:SDR family NAD(P)-dependent oxidoreductase n=1 Tax=Streptomyces sp. 6N223 TaxID=3457412 RepID=UPI003FCF5684